MAFVLRLEHEVDERLNGHDELSVRMCSTNGVTDDACVNPSGNLTNCAVASLSEP